MAGRGCTAVHLRIDVCLQFERRPGLVPLGERCKLGKHVRDPPDEVDTSSEDKSSTPRIVLVAANVFLVVTVFTQSMLLAFEWQV